MSDNIKEKLKNARSAEEAISIARKYGYDTELRNDAALSDDILSGVSGGDDNVVDITRVSHSIVVRDPDSGKVLCVKPY